MRMEWLIEAKRLIDVTNISIDYDPKTVSLPTNRRRKKKQLEEEEQRKKSLTKEDIQMNIKKEREKELKLLEMYDKCKDFY